MAWCCFGACYALAHWELARRRAQSTLRSATTKQSRRTHRHDQGPLPLPGGPTRLSRWERVVLRLQRMRPLLLLVVYTVLCVLSTSLAVYSVFGEL